MESETLTKRLHISGLTPAISPTDLSQRLSSFGTVKALDGFGQLDAVGQPRKFGYATIETTRSKLARCMNLLSGVTWKGAKLRIGEAKPDFRERIQQEHESLKRAGTASGDEPSKKRRRLPRGVQGVHATDMSLVTPENASSRSGWRITPLGRLVRPIRMRPEHPLPEPELVARTSKIKGQASKKPRRKLKSAPSRARRRTIDPTKWGSQHLKGVFLDAEIVTSRSNAMAEAAPGQKHTPKSVETEDEESEESEQDEEPAGQSHPRSTKETSPSLPQFQPQSRVPAPYPPQKNAVPKATHAAWAEDLDQEKQKSLGLLQSLFGDKGDEEWGGEESLDSDIEMGAEASRADAEVEDMASTEDIGQDSTMDVEVNSPPSQAQEPRVATTATSAPVHTKKLKDLFAPREEEGGFSLLGHLDLDLELDDTVDPFIADVPSAPKQSAPIVASAAPAISSFSTAVLDFKRPLFFPASGGARARDALDPTDWRTWFYRTDSPEDIRKHWEEIRGELTNDWKRRHREAVKSRKRRGGAGAEAGD